ncbi:hypothetical protein Csa_011132 [Cucumis sativus]|uniref:Uncharacterized protein n=1 Tax=Cucumis sativus TaxID=3659 RepID=A0A0A0L8E1_CUCSA|nr:hypothetical protein Csa_011132 [Cucumis sativus]
MANPKDEERKGFKTASVQEENASKNDLLKLRMEVIDREVTASETRYMINGGIYKTAWFGHAMQLI